ncbi:MAG TPA: isochorismate synthase [Candidatus Hydrogenedentes bacterium]|nr:isochorismate synthase [Candidatus Hydrogenedentota bacterium]HRK34282.1 isochorismate synthase [Candidatus Hydrogenedentota bacterium]
MTPYLYPDVVEPSLAKKALATLLKQAFESTSSSGKPRRVVRCEVPVDGIEPLAWLESQGNRSRGYWCDREREFELAGVGTADIITAEVLTDYDALFEHLRGCIAQVHPHLHYYGGMRFNLTVPPAQQWLPFGAYRFVLPRFEVLARGDQAYLACNAILSDHEGDLLTKILDALDAMPFPGDGGSAYVAHAQSRADSPGAALWNEQINRTLAEIRRGPIEKVVLARETSFTFAEPVDPIALLRRLGESASHAYRFCFQPKPGAAFIGISPERLYKRQDRFVRTEAVAGTCRANGNEEEDAALARGLLASEKNLREHRHVIDAIRNELSARCNAVHVQSEVSVLRLAQYQHLYAGIEGILDHFNTDAELLRGLHPTPAVGGVPTSAALDWISKTETFDRGWYAGPVGWVGCDSAEFAVAIRSALVTGNTVNVYTGAGIVEGSTPEGEWDELESKLAPYAALLTA